MAGAPKGNRNAAGRKGDWDTAVRAALKRYANNAVKKGEALDKLAEKAIEMGLAGDLDAIKEIANRLDGRPTEHKEVTKTTRIIRETRISAIRSALRGQTAPAAPGGSTIQ